MPGPEVPRLIAKMNAHWAGGGSIDALLADDAALAGWRLSPGSLMLLRSILGISREARAKSGAKRGREESSSFASSLRASLSLLRVDLQKPPADEAYDDDYDDDDFELDDDSDGGGAAAASPVFFFLGDDAGVSLQAA